MACSGDLYAIVLVSTLVSVFILISISHSCEESGIECYFNQTSKSLDIFYIVISSVGSAVFLLYAVILARNKINGNSVQSGLNIKKGEVLKNVFLFIFTFVITVRCINEIEHEYCMIKRFEEATSSGYINQSCAYNPELVIYDNIDRLMYIIFCVIQCGFLFSTLGSRFHKSLVQFFTFTIYITNTVNLVHTLVDSYMSAETEDRKDFQSCLLPGVNITECHENSSFDFLKKFSEISKVEVSFLCMILMFELASVVENPTNAHNETHTEGGNNDDSNCIEVICTDRTSVNGVSNQTSVNNAESSSGHDINESTRLLPNSESISTTNNTDMMIHRQSFWTICCGIGIAISLLLALYVRISFLEHKDTFIISDTTDKSEVLSHLSNVYIAYFVYQMVIKAVMITLLIFAFKMKEPNTRTRINQSDRFHNSIISVSFSGSFIALLVQILGCIISTPLTHNTILIAVKNVVNIIEISLQRFVLLKIYCPRSPATTLSMPLIFFILSFMNGELWLIDNWFGITPYEQFVIRIMLNVNIEKVFSQFVLGFVCFFRIESFVTFFELYCDVKIKN